MDQTRGWLSEGSGEREDVEDRAGDNAEARNDSGGREGHNNQPWEQDGIGERKEAECWVDPEREAAVECRVEKREVCPRRRWSMNGEESG